MADNTTVNNDDVQDVLEHRVYIDHKETDFDIYTNTKIYWENSVDDVVLNGRDADNGIADVYGLFASGTNPTLRNVIERLGPMAFSTDPNALPSLLTNYVMDYVADEIDKIRWYIGLNPTDSLSPTSGDIQIYAPTTPPIDRNVPAFPVYEPKTNKWLWQTISVNNKSLNGTSHMNILAPHSFVVPRTGNNHPLIPYIVNDTDSTEADIVWGMGDFIDLFDFYSPEILDVLSNGGNAVNGFIRNPDGNDGTFLYKDSTSELGYIWKPIAAPYEKIIVNGITPSVRKDQNQDTLYILAPEGGPNTLPTDGVDCIAIAQSDTNVSQLTWRWSTLASFADDLTPVYDDRYLPVTESFDSEANRSGFLQYSEDSNRNPIYKWSDPNIVKTVNESVTSTGIYAPTRIPNRASGKYGNIPVFDQTNTSWNWIYATLNGVSLENWVDRMGPTMGIYAPRTAGETGQVLVSNGNDIGPSWAGIPNIMMVNGDLPNYSGILYWDRSKLKFDISRPLSSDGRNGEFLSYDSTSASKNVWKNIEISDVVDLEYKLDTLASNIIASMSTFNAVITVTKYATDVTSFGIYKIDRVDIINADIPVGINNGTTTVSEADGGGTYEGVESDHGYIWVYFTRSATGLMANITASNASYNEMVEIWGTDCVDVADAGTGTQYNLVVHFGGGASSSGSGSGGIKDTDTLFRLNTKPVNASQNKNFYAPTDRKPWSVLSYGEDGFYWINLENSNTIGNSDEDLVLAYNSVDRWYLRSVDSIGGGSSTGGLSSIFINNTKHTTTPSIYTPTISPPATGSYIPTMTRSQSGGTTSYTWEWRPGIPSPDSSGKILVSTNTGYTWTPLSDVSGSGGSSEIILNTNFELRNSSTGAITWSGRNIIGKTVLDDSVSIIAPTTLMSADDGYTGFLHQTSTGATLSAGIPVAVKSALGKGYVNVKWNWMMLNDPTRGMLYGIQCTDSGVLTPTSFVAPPKFKEITTSDSESGSIGPWIPMARRRSANSSEWSWTWVLADRADSWFNLVINREYASTRYDSEKTIFVPTDKGNAGDVLMANANAVADYTPLWIPRDRELHFKNIEFVKASDTSTIYYMRTIKKFGFAGPCTSTNINLSDWTSSDKYDCNIDVELAPYDPFLNDNPDASTRNNCWENYVTVLPRFRYLRTFQYSKVNTAVTLGVQSNANSNISTTNSGIDVYPVDSKGFAITIDSASGLTGSELPEKIYLDITLRITFSF